MGGKSSTSSSQLQIPAPVLAAYNAATASSQSASLNPFQTYGNEFVAPLNSSQQAGIAGTNAAANEAQPYFGAATGQLTNSQQAAQPYNALAGGLAGQGAQSASVAPLSAQSIQQYESPYLGQVLNSTDALLNQQNQQAQSGQTGNAIMQGAFGGDRAGIAAANLQQQQDLAEANTNAGILNTGYNTALGTAQQQQQTQLQSSGAQEAAAGNIANIGNQVYSQGANTASGLAELGTGAQTAGLSGAQAQLAAGQVGQTTQQAQDTAEYNQFLQQQSYPFQVSQFLANVAEGTGALSGSTTTTTQPGGFFSDDRLKEDIEPVGETYDGQKIIRFRYKGDHRKQIGLSAQKVEKKHPDAVGLAGGYRMVDYGRATDDAAERGHFYAGGLVPANDPIFLHRGRHARGGSAMLPGLTPSDYAAIMQAQAQMYAPFSQQGGLYGGQSGNSVRGGSSYVPAANLPVTNLAVSEPAHRETTPLQNLNAIAALGKTGEELYSDWGTKNPPTATPATPQARGGVAGYATGGSPDPLAIQGASDAYGSLLPKGIVKGVGGYAAGGMPYSQELQSDFGTPTAVTALSIPNASPAAKKQQSPPPAAKNPTALQNTEQLAQTANLGNQTYKLGDSAYHGAAGLLSPTAPSAGVAPAAGSAAPTAGTGLAGGTAADTGAASGAGSAAGTGAASAGTAAAGDAAATSAAGEAAATVAAEEAASDAAVETAGDVALAFAKRGGAIRKKYDTGGAPTDDGPSDIGSDQYSGVGAEWLQDKVPKWLHAIGQWTDPSGSNLDSATPTTAPKPGLAAASSPQTGVAAQPAAPVRHQRRAVQPVAVAQSPVDTTPAPVAQPAPTGVSAPPIAHIAAPTAVADTSPPVAVTPDVPVASPPATDDAAQPTKSSMWDKVHSVLKGVNDSDLTKTKNLIPLLTGIAAMGTAPTRSLGVALASGLGAGAQAYLPTQQAQQKIAQSQAETGLIGAQAVTAHGQPFQQLQTLYAEKGLRLVPDSTGPITDSAGAHYHSEWLQSGVGAPAASGAAPSPTGYKFVGADGLSKVPTSVQDYQVANNSPDKALATASNERMADVYKTGVGAQANQQTLDQFTRSMANLNGPLQAGKLHELALPMVQYFNSAMDEIGQPQLKVGGLDDAQITNKLHAGASLAGQKLSGDRAFGALEVAMSANPNAVMDKGAAMELLAALRAQNQGDIDHMRYYDEFGDAATKHGSPSSKSFLAQDADSAFGTEHSPQQYNVERGALTKFFKSSAFPQYMSALADPNTRESVIQKLDAQGQKFGVKNFSRYFTGS